MKPILVLALLSTAFAGAAEKPSPQAPMVIVSGQVRAPGPVKFDPKLGLYAAIHIARGPNEFGAMNRVKLIRDGKTTVHDLTKDDAKLIELKASDIIEVPQKNLFGR